jgi:hypothetical protein
MSCGRGYRRGWPSAVIPDTRGPAAVPAWRISQRCGAAPSSRTGCSRCGGGNGDGIGEGQLAHAHPDAAPAGGPGTGSCQGVLSGHRRASEGPLPAIANLPHSFLVEGSRWWKLTAATGIQLAKRASPAGDVTARLDRKAAIRPVRKPPRRWQPDQACTPSAAAGHGSHSDTRAPPPSRLARLMRPLCASMISRHRVSPSPPPPGLVE